MRRQSAMQRRMIRQNKVWRGEYALEIGHCMICLGKLGQRMADGRIVMRLDVDEILMGHGPRAKAYITRELCLVSCDYCNIHVTTGLSLAERLVYKYIHDRAHFSLEAIRKAKDNGRQPRVIEFSDVKAAGERLGFNPSEWSEP